MANSMRKKVIGGLVSGILVSTLLIASAARAQQPPAPPAPPPEQYQQPAPPPAQYQQPAPGQYPPPPPAQYQQPAPGQYPQPYQSYSADMAPGYHQHDGGFIRLQLGGGYTSFGQSDNDVTIAGSGAAFNFAFGGAISNGLILYGEVFSSIASQPTLSVGGSDLGEADGDAAVTGLGAGLAYYLPSNTFFSGSLVMQQLSLIDSNGDEAGETEYGPGVKIQVGHEWWVSHDWAVGLAGQFLAGTMDDQDEGFSGETLAWTASSFSLLFSATYN
jgi:hypothetical protein